MIQKIKPHLLFTILALVSILFFLLDLLMGSVTFSWIDLKEAILNDSSIYSTIFWEIRMPKAIAAILIGSALSVAGLLMQTYFRNPLAGPYILGISSGASLGVALFVFVFSAIGITLGQNGYRWGCALFALTGALLLFVVIISVSVRVRDSVTLLIVGIMIGAVAGALISVLQHCSDADSVKMYVNWTLGSLSMIGWQELKIMVPLLVLGFLSILFFVKPLDTLLVGEEFASSVGVQVRQCQFSIIGITVLLTGISTAFAGPIGFVGIAVPHIVRMLIRSSVHKKLIPCCILVGANMMLLSDILSQLPRNGYVIPINAVTALLGAPVVIWVLMGKQKIQV